MSDPRTVRRLAFGSIENIAANRQLARHIDGDPPVEIGITQRVKKALDISEIALLKGNVQVTSLLVQRNRPAQASTRSIVHVRRGQRDVAQRRRSNGSERPEYRLVFANQHVRQHRTRVAVSATRVNEFVVPGNFRGAQGTFVASNKGRLPMPLNRKEICKGRSTTPSSR